MRLPSDCTEEQKRRCWMTREVVAGFLVCARGETKCKLDMEIEAGQYKKRGQKND